MIYKIFSIHDVVSCDFSKPVLDFNRNSALRNFSDLVAEPGSCYNSHPTDYALYELGEFNSSTGKITLYDAIDRVALASDLVKPVL